MIRDLRYSIRSLRRSPGFALAAVATLAIGIGANTAVFSLVNGVLLNPLPFESPERLVMVWGRHTTIGRETASLPDYLDWKRQSKSFADMAALANTRYNLSTEGEPAEFKAVSAQVGRALSADPAFTSASDASKQEIAESMLVQAVLQARDVGARQVVCPSWLRALQGQSPTRPNPGA